METYVVKVLVVEDDRVFAALLHRLLEASASTRFELTHVESLSEALQRIPREIFDVTLLDLSLPDSRGLSTFTRIHAAAPMSPIIILTGSDDEKLALEAIRQGAQDYLIKVEMDGRLLARALRYAIERKRVGEQLREREEFFRLISENVQDLMAVIDKDGKRVYNSPSYEGLFGDLGQLRGTSSFEEIHPEDRERIRKVFDESMATGVGHRTEFRFLLKDGRIRHIESQGSVVRDDQGQPAKMVVVSRDITERKEAEKALRESEQRYKRLLASTTDYIYSVSVENGRPVSTRHGLGSAAVTGYSPMDYEVDPYLWFSMIHPEDRSAVVEMGNKVLAGQSVPPLEHRLIHKDGSIRWVKNTPVSYKNHLGQVIAYDGLISNITERKQAEAKLQAAYTELAVNEKSLREALADLRKSHEELKAAQLHLIQAEKMESVGMLAAGVAHEVKNPLQIILLGLQYLARFAPPEDQNAQRALADMRNAINRADAIIRGLLEFSASNQLDVKDESLNSVVEQALWLVNYEMTTHQITLAKELAADIPPLRLDRIKMEQVFINLFLNAIQAMTQRGVLIVRTHLMPGAKDHHHPAGRLHPANREKSLSVVAEVEDTGAGIPKDKLTKVFDPFYTTKPPGKGTGLGLTVVKNIVELHGGSVVLHNRPEGGIRATITFKIEPNKAG